MLGCYRTFQSGFDNTRSAPRPNVVKNEFSGRCLSLSAQQSALLREQESDSKCTSLRSCLMLIHGKKLVLAQGPVVKSLTCPVLGTVL